MLEMTLKFMGEHWFLTWCLAWLVWGVFWLAAIVVVLPYRALRRFLRTCMVVCRGWPPAHLDADGDWKPEPKKAEEE